MKDKYELEILTSAPKRVQKMAWKKYRLKPSYVGLRRMTRRIIFSGDLEILKQLKKELEEKKDYYWIVDLELNTVEE